MVLSPIFPSSPRSLKNSDHLSANNLYNRFQSAYRPGHSTETALLKIVNDLLLSLDDGNVFLLALLDLSAAFDTIDHSISLHRLHHDFGIQGTAHDCLLASFATHLSQLPSLPVFHRDQSLDLSFSFSVQLLFLL